MAKCRICGYAVGEADRFCTSCGRRLPPGLLAEMRGWARAWPALLSFGWLAGLFWVFQGGFLADPTVRDLIRAALFAGLALGGIKLARALGAWAVSGAARAWFVGQMSWVIFWAVSGGAWFVLPGVEGAATVDRYGGFEDDMPLWMGKLLICGALGAAGLGMWHLGRWIRRRHLEDRAKELDDGGA